MRERLTFAAFILTIVFFLSHETLANDRILVKYRPGAAHDRVSMKAIRHFRHSGIMVIKPGKGESVGEAVARLRQDPSVLIAEPDYRVQAIGAPDDEYFEQLWGIERINTTAAWDYGYGDPSVVVAVIDSGVDYNHPDLEENLWNNDDEVPDNGIDDDGNGYIDDYHGYDFAYEDPDPYDGLGHGTHCAGTIAAVGNNGLGVVGVAPGVRIMPVKFLDDDGYGYTSDAISAIEYAIANGAKILSNSWGGGDYSLALEDAILTAEELGVIFIAAAGNNSSNTDMHPEYPACYPVNSILSVGALDKSDIAAYFSNYGARTVDVFAPGVDIFSTIPGNSYRYYSGTSMACPHASGIAALMLSVEPSMSPMLIKEYITGGVITIAALDDLCLSGGVVDSYRALYDMQYRPCLVFEHVDVSGGNGNSVLEPGETLSLTITLANRGCPLAGVKARLVSSNELVKVTSAESILGDAAQGSLTSNITPFMVRADGISGIIDAGLSLEVEYGQGMYTCTIDIPLYAGRWSRIMIVDDDGQSIMHMRLVNSLERIGLSGSLTVIDSSKACMAAETRPSVCIWHTGALTGTVISPEDLNALKKILCAGVPLVLAGDAWARNLKDDSFCEEYLRCRILSTKSRAREQSGKGILMGINYWLSKYLLYHNSIGPAGNAVILASDIGSETSGSMVLSESTDGTAPAVSISFDLAAMSDGNIDAVLKAVIRRLSAPRLENMTPRDGSIEFSIGSLPEALSTEIVLSGDGTDSTFSAGTRYGIVAGLVNGSVYTVRARSVFPGGMYSLWSDGIEVIPDKNGGRAILPARNPVCTEIEKGLLITWSPSPDSRVDSYRVDVHTGSGADIEDTTSGCSYLVQRDRLADNDSGTVDIYPVDSSGIPGWPCSIDWEYEDTCPPAEVTGLSVKKVSDFTCTAKWNGSASSDIKGYRLTVQKENGTIHTKADTARQTSYNLYSLMPDKTYYFRVQAIDTSGNISSGTTVAYNKKKNDNMKDDRAGGLFGCDSGDDSDHAQAGPGAFMMSLLLNMLVVSMLPALHFAVNIFFRKR